VALDVDIQGEEAKGLHGMRLRAPGAGEPPGREDDDGEPEKREDEVQQQHVVQVGPEEESGGDGEDGEDRLRAISRARESEADHVP